LREQLRIAKLVKGKTKAVQLRLMKKSGLKLYKNFVSNLTDKILNITTIIVRLEEAEDNKEVRKNNTYNSFFPKIFINTTPKKNGKYFFLCFYPI
jgi:hypothetical protein